MRLPIQAMQPARIRSQSEPDRWHRTVIIDFEESEHLLLLQPRGSARGGDRARADAEVEPDEEEAVPARGTVPSPSPKQPGFERGTKVEVEVTLPDGIRRFSSVIRGSEPTYGGSMRIDWPAEGTRIQRRDYVRVDVSLPATVTYAPIVEGEKLGETRIRGTTIDMSAGGARLRLAEQIPDNTPIELNVEMPPLDAQSLQARVVRSEKLERKGGAMQYYWVAIQFTAIDEALRKTLTQLVFDIQREQLKRSRT